jgi:hypothetical protein
MMTLKNKTLLCFAALAISAASSAANALSIDWKGTYRFEWTQVDRPTLGTPYGMKAYGLNYLSLSPKIIAADGVNIVSKFDVLANQDPAYADAQFGQLFGQGWGAGGAQKNVNSQNQRSTSLLVSQLYLNINQEYGALVVGRAPLEFGLGMTHNAGNGAFDHWADTEDMVGYKFIVDNFFFMPIFGRVYDTISQGNQAQDMIFHLQYESKETGSLIGIMHQTRKASQGVNDAPIPTTGAASTNTLGSSEYNVQTINFILGREWERFGFKLEAGFNSGNNGQKTAAGEDVKANGYGVVADLYFPRKESKFGWNLKMGMATGDDPTSANAFEGFQFDRNYDVAMLMFNHRLGQRDFLTTGSIKDSTKDASNSLDDEAISNAMFVAPKMTYAWNDRLDFNNTLIYGQLLTNPVSGATNPAKDLGLEWDIEFVYKPTDRLQWVNQIGILAPGKAFKNGDGAGPGLATGGLETATTFGFASKAAISF